MASDEQCDDGNSDNDDGCSADCSEIEQAFTCVGYACGTTSCNSICSDGLRTESEECDDSNLISGDGCSRSCVIEVTLSLHNST